MNSLIFNNKYEIHKNGIIIKLKTNQPIKQYIHKTKGYVFVSLGNNRSVLLHRIIAKTFISNPNNYPEVNHIDGNKLNNDISNLEWCTAKQNTKHAIINNLRKTPKGKQIINTITNQVYPSIIKAWEDSDKLFSYTHLKTMLQGINPNKTPYKYL
jgi:hypothetical protein